MKLSRPRSWAHPVVSPLSDDIVSAEFDFRLEVLAEHDRWILKVVALNDDRTLSTLISQGLASYVLHVECRRTNYRAAFVSVDSTFEKQIAATQIFGSVDVALMVVARNDIGSYRHPDQHSDYRNCTFQLNAGEPIAVAVSQSFDAFLDVDPILKLNSIIDIRRDDGISSMEVDCCAGDRIIVKLPSTDYESYREIRMEHSVRGLLASTVILPALLDSLFLLRSLGSDIDEFKAEHGWSRRVLARLELANLDVLDADADSTICLRAAQRLLVGPVRRSLRDLNELFV